MVNFDKFEKRVKETYGKQEFPFDEQNWEKAAKMIDASRKGKNRGGIFLLSAVALLCTTGLVYYFGFSDSTNSLTKNGVASNDLNTNKELVIKSQSNEQAPIENVAVNDNNNTAANSNSSVETLNNNTVSKNTTANLNATSSNKSSVALTKTKDAVNSEKSATNSNSSSNSNTKTSEENTNTSANSKTNENESNTNSKKPEPTKENAKNTIPSTLGNNTSNTTPVAIKSIPTGENGNSQRLGNVSNTTENTSVKQKEIVTDSINEIVTNTVKPTESIVTDSVPVVKTLRADSIKFPEPVGSGISYATNVKMEHNHKNFLFMEAGATYLLGWNGSGKTDAGGFNLVAGLNFQHYFTNIISAQIGLQYNSISNLTQTSHTISTVNYDLGIEKDITSIKYQKLHYVVAPIKVAINVGKDNILGIGCNIAYLLNSESKKEKYKTSSNDPNAIKNNLTSTKETGYVQGFNPIDVQVSAFYRRKIYKGLSVNAEFIYGLTDTKNNAFFNSNTFERTTGFKLTLCYDLFKK